MTSQLQLQGLCDSTNPQKPYEGCDGNNWISLSHTCACPYVTLPFTDESHLGNLTTQNNRIQMTIDFSHQMDPASFIYGTNVIVSGNVATSTGGNFIWKHNNTVVVIESNENWVDLNNTCFAGWDLQIIGTGINAVKGINGNVLDGDKDGCCGGDYLILFVILC